VFDNKSTSVRDHYTYAPGGLADGSRYRRVAEYISAGGRTSPENGHKSKRPVAVPAEQTERAYKRRRPTVYRNGA